jgi:hypothetical protein
MLEGKEADSVIKAIRILSVGCGKFLCQDAV